MNVVFLDFDGVVNIPWWQKDKCGNLISKFNFPHDGTVNNYQAIQWISEFYEKYDYSIIVSSTWRMGEFDYKQCLYDSGLRKDIKVLGATPILHKERGNEITEWLKNHSEVKNYLIFDDDSDMTVHMDRLVKCNCFVGFTLNQYNYAVSLHNAFNNN